MKVFSIYRSLGHIKSGSLGLSTDCPFKEAAEGPCTLNKASRSKLKQISTPPFGIPSVPSQVTKEPSYFPCALREFSTGPKEKWLEILKRERK